MGSAANSNTMASAASGSGKAGASSAGSSELMAASTGMQGLSSFASAFAQSQAAEAQGAYKKQQYETNAELAEIQAKDAIDRGNTTANNIQKRGQQMIGDQRASMAAQGIDINSGSAADIQADTAGMAAHDAMTAKNNAWLEAWGYKMQATQYQGEGVMAGLASEAESRNTILTGGMQLAGSGLKAYGYGRGGSYGKDT